jgi:WD40 repeat protein
VWDAASRKTVATLAGHGRAVSHAQFSPDGARIVTATYNSGAIVWDVGTAKAVCTFSEHEDSVWTAQFSPDGVSIITASSDNSACTWDAATGALIAKFVGHQAAVWNAQFSPNGVLVVTASADKTERIACEFARTVPAISDVSQIIICPQKGIVCKAPVNAEPSRLAANHSAQSRRRSRRSD